MNQMWWDHDRHKSSCCGDDWDDDSWSDWDHCPVCGHRKKKDHFPSFCPKKKRHHDSCCSTCCKPKRHCDCKKRRARILIQQQQRKHHCDTFWQSW